MLISIILLFILISILYAMLFKTNKLLLKVFFIQQSMLDVERKKYKKHLDKIKERLNKDV